MVLGWLLGGRTREYRLAAEMDVKKVVRRTVRILCVDEC